MNTKNIGIYVHIPFCKSKCKYCDFKSYAKKENIIEKNIKRVNFEHETIGITNKNDFGEGKDKLAVVDTIYIGGGTPSFIDENHIAGIMETIKSNYNIIDCPEVTIEVNPGTVTENKLKKYIECGINRLSIGLQTCNDILLQKIGRIHKYEDFESTYKLARKVGFKNINVDLMIGLPEQTILDIKDSLNKVIQCNPEHISVYSLILEEGTPLFDEIANKKVELVDEEEERKMYWEVKKILQDNGYEHYEISNFAKPNCYSKHNWNCWNQEEYIGVGVSAHSYTNGVRYSNIDEIEKYIQNYRLGDDIYNLVFHEKQDKRGKMNEYMILGLRKIEGIHIKKFEEKFLENPIELYKEELEDLKKKELIVVDNENIRLTDKGLDFANIVWEEFV